MSRWPNQQPGSRVPASLNVVAALQTALTRNLCHGFVAGDSAALLRGESLSAAFRTAVRINSGRAWIECRTFMKPRLAPAVNLVSKKLLFELRGLSLCLQS